MTLQVQADEFFSEIEDDDSTANGSGEEDSNNNAKLKEVDTDEVQIVCDQEKIDEEERKSMMRFARFLEMNGYISKQMDAGNGTQQRVSVGTTAGTSGAQNQTQARNGKADKDKKGTNLYKHNDGTIPSSNSDLTLYKGAVRMELNKNQPKVLTGSRGEAIKDNGICNNMGNRLSSSSEDMGEADTSDETDQAICLPIANDNISNAMQNANLADDQMHFENFVGARLKRVQGTKMATTGSTSATTRWCCWRS